MTKKILIIDDERTQAEALAFKIHQMFTDAETIIASSEKEIESAIVEKFYNLAILDIRLDNYVKNGIDFARDIIEQNPFAKILFVSGFLPEYMHLVNPLMATGKILGFSDKKEYDQWMRELEPIISGYYADLSTNNEVNSALMDAYATAKNESDTYKKGLMFENFVTLLFRSIGYGTINKRVKDRSLNEVDLVIRNEIDDTFLSKFGKYILIECKNKPETPVNKNDFIIFQSKLDATNDLAVLGFIFATSYISRNTYLEAIRESKGKNKVIFVDNALMEQLLSSNDLREGLKKIIDGQVKDN